MALLRRIFTRTRADKKAPGGEKNKPSSYALYSNRNPALGGAEACGTTEF